ncbi:MAG: hypothetical protein QMC38_00445 [Sinobacterium sp.]
MSMLSIELPMLVSTLCKALVIAFPEVFGQRTLSLTMSAPIIGVVRAKKW